MNIIVTSQSVSWAAWGSSGGTETLSRPVIDEQDLEDGLLDWLRRSGSAWTITASGPDDSIVISHWSDVEVETMRTTIDCNPGDYEALLGELKALKASFQQQDGQ